MDLLVGAQPSNASITVFECLNNEGIVYDGRLVVDGAFRTSDPHIYAAGTVAKLSRKYAGGGVLLEQYESREVGAALAESVIASFAGDASCTTTAPPLAPALGSLGGCGRVVGCAVPSCGGAAGGQLKFLFAGCPAAHAAPSLEGAARAMRTCSAARGVMHITMDDQSRVHSVAYLGATPPPAHLLASLIGLHESYLGNLAASYEAGAVPCLVAHLTSQPLFGLLAGEHFGELRRQLLASGLQAAAHAVRDHGPQHNTTTQVLQSCHDAIRALLRDDGTEVQLDLLQGAV